MHTLPSTGIIFSICLGILPVDGCILSVVQGRQTTLRSDPIHDSVVVVVSLVAL